jgi:D-alanyl-lipoteichoic acid acyltransferase DltB (MBOAT superfamily)
MSNFNMPYFSRDIAEFWRRWHISLNTWFRDYVYIPLGGSRTAKAKIVRNTFVIFLLSGLWHGANWTFIAWGAYHALLFLPLILLGRNRKYTGTIAEGKFLPRPKEFLMMLLTFVLVVMGWIIFRSENIGCAWQYIYGMFGKDVIMAPYSFFTYGNKAGWFVVVMLVVEWLQRQREHGLEISFIRRTWVRFLIYYLIISFSICFGNFGENQFIYFNF